MSAPRRLPSRAVALLCVSLIAGSLIGCGGPTYVSDAEEPNLDSYTMGLDFDRKDLNRLYDAIIAELLSSSVVKRWERQSVQGPPPNVAIFPMRNETSEHIGTQLDALLSRFETDLVNKTAADIISHENQPELIAEVKRQQSSAYNPQRLAQYGRQLGAQYFVTGKVYDAADQVSGERRVQYFMFVQVIEVATGKIHFQDEAEVTKALVD